MNSITIIGNLTNDVRYNEVQLPGTQQKTPVASFSVAVNTGRGDNQTTDYFTVTCWRQLATNAATYLKKGRKVAVTGPVHLRQYVAQQGQHQGQNVAYLDVQASSMEFLSPRDREDNAAAAATPVAAAPARPVAQPTIAPAPVAPAAAPAGYAPVQPVATGAYVPYNEEDLPF